MPRRYDRTEKPLRKIQLPQQRSVPIAGTCIQQFGGGSDAIFVRRYSGQVIPEQTWHEQKFIRHIEQNIPFLFTGVQLKQGIDRHHLDACRPVMRRDIGLSHPVPERSSKRLVPITEGIAQQITVRIDQPIIHPPCIDTDTAHVKSMPDSLLDSGFHLLEQIGKIPIQMVSQTYLAIRETVDLHHFQLITRHTARYHPTAAAAEIYR